MTELLEKALAKVLKLPAEKQDAIASLILDELKDEQKWDAAFSKSQKELTKMADKVRSDVREGGVKKMGFDEV